MSARDADHLRVLLLALGMTLGVVTELAAQDAPVAPADTTTTTRRQRPRRPLPPAPDAADTGETAPADDVSGTPGTTPDGARGAGSANDAEGTGDASGTGATRDGSTARESLDGGVSTRTPAPVRAPRSGDDALDGEAIDEGRAAAADAGVSEVTLLEPDAGPLDGGVVDASASSDTDLDAGVAALAPGGAAPDAAPPPAPVPPQPTTTVVQVPVPFVPATEASDPWAGLREIIPGIPTGGIRPLGLLSLLALLALASSLIERLRARLLRDGWLPTLLSMTQVVVRLLALLILLALVIQVVPADVRWVVYFILMASGAALGWSMRDVMPDLIAGIVIVFERRIRRGIWIRSDSFSGSVERIGLRSSWLRDNKGHRVAVPNRFLMQAPIVSHEEGDTIQEVLVRLGGRANAADIRRALTDAVLASPWTPPDSAPQVMRDPVDPDLWQVRSRLLSTAYATTFQGQLLERAEAHLAALEARASRVRELPHGDEPPHPPTTKFPKLDKGDKPADKGDKPTEKSDKPAEKSERPERSPKPPTSP